MDENDMAKLLTAKEVVAKLFFGRISYKLLLKLSNEGSIPCLRIQKRFFYNVDVVTEWLQRNTSTPAYAKLKV